MNNDSIKDVPPADEHIVLTNDVRQTALLGKWVESVCEKLDSDPARLFNIQLALEESVANIMLYAYPGQTDCEIALTAKKGNDSSLRFTIEDEGIPFDPTRQAPPDLAVPTMEREVGGLGIFLIRELSRSITYRRVNGKNVLEIVF